MRRYDDPVEVCRGRVRGQEAPERFRWRGRWWKVRAVVAHWVETAPWWQSPRVRAVLVAEGPEVAAGDLLGELLVECETWRVEAGRGARGGSAEGVGVFDLRFDGADGRWQLVGCVD